MDKHAIEIIEKSWENRHVSPDFVHQPEIRNVVEEILQFLDSGSIRVSEKTDQGWIVHEWVKKAILLSFLLNENKVISDGPIQFYDKVPLKFSSYDETSFKKSACRVVPPSIVRYGSFVGKGVVLMPSFVNIGSYIDEGTMVDTWATVGSCAQIGKNVHLSGGVGIGGVLEPLQSSPTIIEDNCFIGARSEIVEGVIIEENSVLAMGIFLSKSTKIFNRLTGEITYGRIPRNSVVVPGSLPAKDGSHSLSCAVIVKQVDSKTRSKTTINDLLRI